jgi:hypothetical protein
VAATVSAVRVQTPVTDTQVITAASRSSEHTIDRVFLIYRELRLFFATNIATSI